MTPCQCVTWTQNFSESTEAIKPLTDEEKKHKVAELQERLKQKRAERAVEVSTMNDAMPRVMCLQEVREKLQQEK